MVKEGNIVVSSNEWGGTWCEACERSPADADDQHEAASWLLLNNQNSSPFLFGADVDDYLDLMDSTHNSCFARDDYLPHKSYGDSVVPALHQHFHSSYPYIHHSSLPQNVSFSSIDVAIVPESTTTDVSVSQSRAPKGTIDLFSGPPIPIPLPSQLTPMDREARVLRYREKKKTRKFQKTIRYASRKAYAETRPRIKGRFAKRTQLQQQPHNVHHIFDSGYGIVPSF